jgi:hypothetical protein
VIERAESGDADPDLKAGEVYREHA